MLIEAKDEDFESIAEWNEARGLPVAEGGFASPEILAMLRDVARSVRADFTPTAWLIVEDGEIVGLVSLKNAPDGEGIVEIGYGIARSRHRRGFAGRAVADVLDWARSHPAIRIVTAETAEDNFASQRVLARNGLVLVGRCSDEEDGELLLWETETAMLSTVKPAAAVLSVPSGS